MPEAGVLERGMSILQEYHQQLSSLVDFQIGSTQATVPHPYSFLNDIANDTDNSNSHGVIISNDSITKTSQEADPPYPDFTQITWVRGIFMCLFFLEFAVGVTGNFLVCLTVYRTKAMHSPVNYYIVNLGVCDFLIAAFVLPTKLFELTSNTNMLVVNDVVCTVVRYLETIVVFTSVFTLVAICIERYYAVVYPVRSRIHLKGSRVGPVLAVVWIIPCLVAAPNVYPSSALTYALFSSYGQFTRTTCFDNFSDKFRRAYFLFLFFFMFILPLIFIGATCFSIFRALMKKMPMTQPQCDNHARNIEKGRRKVAKMVLVIVFTFILCWSPYFLVTVVTQLQSENFLHKGHFFFTMLCINLFGFTNSCINPIIYFAMSTRFRVGFKEIVGSVWQCTKKVRFSTGSNNSSSEGKNASQKGMTTNNGCTNNNERRDSGSPSPMAPKNNSSGNLKEHRPASQRRRVSACPRSQTILLSFRSHPTPNCQSQLIPLTSRESDVNRLHPQFEFEDIRQAQESSIV